MFEQFFKDVLTAISPALQTLIVGLVTLILGQLSAYLHRKYAELKIAVSSDQRYFLDFVVSRAVDTVEQLYGTFGNSIKKTKAVEIAQAALKNYGVNVDLQVIEDAIEAALFGKKEISKG
jgi:hypothetical protein